MKKIFTFKKTTVLVATLIFTTVALVGCGNINLLKNKMKNNLLGNSGKLTEYDDFGNNTLTLKNVKVSMGLLENSANLSVETNGFKSEVLDVVIDDDQLIHVGSTMIFAEKGIEPVEDFDYEYLKRLSGENKPTYVPIERNINSFKNSLTGKKRTVIIKSQQGIVVGVYESDKVSIEIPTDLPQTTLLSLDGKALYIYRADYDIIDSSLLK